MKLNKEAITVEEDKQQQQQQQQQDQIYFGRLVEEAKRIHLAKSALNQPRLSSAFLFYPFASLRSLLMSRPTHTHHESSSSSSPASHSLFDPHKIHLFVRAGQDGRSQGACPFCQAVFMQLLCKAATNKFNFDVITINMDNPPKEFKELSIKPPVLIHGSTDLLSHLNTSNNHPNYGN